MTNSLTLLPHHKISHSTFESKEESHVIKLEIKQDRGLVPHFLSSIRASNHEINIQTAFPISAEAFTSLSRLSDKEREYEFLKNFSLRLVRHPQGLFRLHINPRLFGGGNGCSGGFSEGSSVGIPIVPQSRRPVAVSAVKVTATYSINNSQSPVFFGSNLTLQEENVSAFENIDQAHSSRDVALFLKSASQGKPDQQLLQLASSIIGAYRGKNNKTKEHTLEVSSLAEAENPLITKELIKALTEEYEKSEFLELYLLQALKKTLLFAPQDALDADDLVRILRITFKQFNKLHKQESTNDKLHATLLSLGELLDLMGDANVEGVERVELHDAFYKELDSLSSHTQLRIASAASYALQSLVRVPNDESKLMSRIRRGIAAGKTIKNLYDVVAKQDLSFLFDAYTNAKEAYHSQETKKAWHDEARRSSVLIYFGKWKAFEEWIIVRGKETKDPRVAGFIATLVKEALSQKLPPEIQTGCVQLLKDIVLNEKKWGSYESDKAKIVRDKIQKENEWGALILNADDRMVKKGVIKYLVDLAGDPNTHIRDEARKCLQDLSSVKKGPLQELIKEEVPYVGAIPIRVPSREIQGDLNELFTQVRRGGFLSVVQKIQNIQSVALKNSDVLEDLSTYIPVRGSSQIFSESVSDFDLQEKLCSFTTSSKKIFLLAGESGSGKTLALRALGQKLWKEWASGKPIPLFISLAESKHPFTDLIEEALEGKGFSEQEIKELKKDFSFIFLLDGYDELGQLKNLYLKNNLSAWNAKVIISCRKQYLAEMGSGYRSLFVSTLNEKAIQESFEECLIKPFTKDQIESFFQEKTGQGLAYASIKKIPGLLDMLENPFLLKLAVEVLPELQKRFGPDNQDSRTIRRIDLYDEFTSKWFYKSKSRLIEAGNPLILNGASSIGHAEAIFEEFCKELAAEMFLSGKVVVEYKAKRPLFSSHVLASNPWERFFGNYNADIRNAIPLVFDGSYTYAFLHKSLLEYFGAKALIENETNFKLGSRLLTQEHELLKFLSEHVQRNSSFQKSLMDSILNTREKSDDTSLIAGANSITILNKAGVSFSQKDFSRIQVPKADLRGAIFHGTNLRGANLSECQAAEASFDFADLSQANLKGLDSGILPSFIGHISSVVEMVLSKDRTILISRSLDAVITWDLKNKSKIQKWANIRAFYLSPSGEELILKGDKSLSAWNLNTSELLYTLPYSQKIGPCFFCQGACFLLPLDDALKVSQIETKTGKLLAIFDFKQEFTHRTTWALLENDQILYCNDKCFSIKKLGERIQAANLLKDWDASSLFRKGQKKLYGLCLNNKTIQILKSFKDHPLLTLAHSEKIIEWVFSRDESYVLSKDNNNKVYVWDLKTGKQIFSINNVQGTLHEDSVFGTKKLALAHEDRLIHIWNLETKKIVKTFVGSASTISKVAVSFDEQTLFSIEQANIIKLWPLSQLDQAVDSVQHTHLSASFLNSQGNLVTLSETGHIQIRDQRNGNVLYRLKTGLNSATGAASSLDGTQIFIVDKKGLFFACNLSSGQLEQQLPFPYSIHSFFPLNDSSHILIVSKFGEVVIWDLKKQMSLYSFLEERVRITTSCISPDQRHLAISSSDGKLHVFDIESKKLLYTENVKSISSILISDDRLILASKGTVEIRNLIKGNIESTIKQEHCFITALSYSNKSKRLAIGDSAGEIHLWDLKDNSHIFSIKAHERGVMMLGWNSDCFLQSVGKDNLLQLWNVQEKVELMWRSSSQFSAKNAVIEDVQDWDNLEKNIWIEQGAAEFKEETLLARLENEKDAAWLTQIDEFGNTLLPTICNQYAPAFWKKLAEQESAFGQLKVFNKGLLHSLVLSKNLTVKEKQNTLAEFFKLGVSLDEEDLLGLTPLYNAVRKGFYGCLSFLVEEGADINVASKHGLNLTMLACRDGHADCLQFLLEIGTDINAVSKDGSTPALFASRMNHPECLQLLAEKGANLNAASNIGWTPTMYACRNGHLECLQVLSHNGADLNVASREGWTAALFASSMDQAECLQFLAEKGADLNAASREGWTPIVYACRNGQFECLQVLAANNAELNAVYTGGFTLVLFASQGGHLNCLKFLVEHGADVNNASRDGWTPALLASRNGHLECLKFLAEHGADLNAAGQIGWTPVLFASRNGHFECLEFLAEHGADLNAASKDGTTPLMLSSQNGHLACLQLLAKKGVSIDAADPNGLTPAMFASLNGHYNCLQFLAEKGADLNVADKRGWTCVMIACNGGHFSCLELLAKHGADLDIGDKSACTPAMVAAKNGHIDCLRFLTEEGVGINTIDEEGRTAAMYASQNGRLRCLQFLVEEGEDLNNADDDGCTAAMFASGSGHLSCLQYLAEKGADLSIADKDGRTATTFARDNGHLNCLEFLINTGAGINESKDDSLPADALN